LLQPEHLPREGMSLVGAIRQRHHFELGMGRGRLVSASECQESRDGPRNLSVSTTGSLAHGQISVAWTNFLPFSINSLACHRSPGSEPIDDYPGGPPNSCDCKLGNCLSC